MLIHQITNSKGNYNYNAYIYRCNGFQNHFHKNFELVYVIDGSVEMNINGEDTKLTEGETLLISPYSIHDFYVQKNSQVWIGVFSEDFIHSFAQKYGSCIFSKFRMDKSTESFLKEHIFFQGQPSDVYITKACLYMACSECLKNSNIINSKASQNFRSRVTDYISNNLSEEITMEKTATELGYEYHYFSSLFHQNFAINFSEFINMYRFEMACEMLRDNTSEITYIATECGFASIRNFNRVFKKFGGCTPTEFRRIDNG